MTESVTAVTTCRVCGLSDWLDVLSLGPLPVANGLLEADAEVAGEPRYPLDVAVCRRCRLMSLRHVVSPDLLFRHYLYVTSESRLMNRHMTELTAHCTGAYAVPPDSLVVEVGSNVGHQLALFRAAGMRVLGVDPAVNLAAVAARNGIETVPEFFTSALAGAIRERHGPARVVLARHVLAHIDDVADVLAGIRMLLDRDGVVVVEVPYLRDLLDGTQFDTIYHEHLSYFSVTTLELLLRRNGLRMIEATRAAVHGGSLVVTAAPAGSARPASPSVAALIAAERDAGLGGDESYRRFAERTRLLSGAVRTLVRELRTGGATIAAYGASAKGSTLLNVAGLTRAEIAFCSDTTELKQGRLLPGAHIPVWSPDRARRHPPDYYLLLAWNYADEILANERDYLARGGRFIVPIPRLTVATAATLHHPQSERRAGDSGMATATRREN